MGTTTNDLVKAGEKHAIPDRLVGIVRCVYKKKWLHITMNDTREDLFVHQVALAYNGLRKLIHRLREKDVVEFDVVHSEKGPEVGNMTRKGSGPVQENPCVAANVRRPWRYLLLSRGQRKPYATANQTFVRTSGVMLGLDPRVHHQSGSHNFLVATSGVQELSH